MHDLTDPIPNSISLDDPIVAAGDPRSAINLVGSELFNAKKRERNRAVLFGSTAGVSAIGGIWFLTQKASEAFSQIDASARANPPVSDTAIIAETTYLIVRGTGLSAIVGGIIYFMFNLARSALDQSTRYEKRWIASHLIDYALHSPDVSPKRLESAHKIIEVWGSTIESAYTPPRVAKQVGSMKLSAGKDGGSMETTDPAAP